MYGMFHGITVYDFVFLCTETGMLKVNLWSNDTEDVVWSGTLDDMPDKYRSAEVNSWDAPEKEWTITINID